MTNAEYGSTPNKTPHSAVHHNVWVVIADKTEARVLSKNNREFDVLKTFQANERMDDGLDNNTVGRGHHDGARHKYEPSLEESRQVELALAKDVASFLETALATREFSELVLVAPPQMLGQIRKALSSNILKTLVAQSDKNLMNVAGHQLRKELLAIAPGPDQL